VLTRRLSSLGYYCYPPGRANRVARTSGSAAGLRQRNRKGFAYIQVVAFRNAICISKLTFFIVPYYHNNQVYSQPNAGYKLNNTTDNKTNQIKTKLNIKLAEYYAIVLNHELASWVIKQAKLTCHGPQQNSHVQERQRQHTFQLTDRSTDDQKCTVSP